MLGLGAFDGIDPRHDFRVAIRRLRRALQLYSDLWDTEAIDSLRSQLGELSNMIGAVRDSELAVEWLSDAEKGAPKAARNEMRRIRHDIERARRTALGTLVREIRAGRVRSVMESTADWLENADRFLAMSASDDRQLVDEIPRELAKHAKRIRAYDGTIREDDSLRLHVLRKQCRRMRYVVEAWYAALGPGRRRLATQLKNVQDALGDIHDADVRSEHWTKEGNRKGNVWLAERCRYDRNSAWDRFESEWPKLVKLLGKKSIGKVAQHE
jgi:CHAD domain-containing protein